MRRFPVTLRHAISALVVLFGALLAQAQGQFPSTSSTAGVTIVSPGRSIKPQELTPTEPYRARPFPPAWDRNNSIPGAAITEFGR